MKNNGNEVILKIDKGQFMGNVSGDAYVRVKFDNTKPQNYYYNEAADGSSNYIFLNAANDFIKKIKTAQKVIIESQFYNNGVKQMEFNVSGLQWK
jgi:hypothetical protein